MLIFIFLSAILSLKPIYIVPDFDQSSIYSTITEPDNYPDCPTDFNKFQVRSSTAFNKEFIDQYPICAAKILQVQYNEATGKVEQLPGIITDSAPIGSVTELPSSYSSLISKLKEKGYTDNVDLFSVSYNYYLHPVTSFSVYDLLKEKIEEIYSQTQEEAIIISFGQGSSFSSIFISNYSLPEWTTKYISKVIFIAPAFAGSSTFSQLLSQNLDSLPENAEMKKTISMMPGLQIMLPNYEIFQSKTIIYNLYSDFDQHNGTFSFEFLKNQQKVDDSSEKVFKSAVESYLKVPIPEPPVPSLVIYNDGVNQTVSYVINRHKSNKVTSIYEISGDGKISADGAEYACKKWENVMCKNLHNSTLHDGIISSSSVVQYVVDFIQMNDDEKALKNNALFIASGFNGSPIYATVTDPSKAPMCPPNLKDYIIYTSFVNKMHQFIDESDSSLWLSNECISHLTKVDLNDKKDDVTFSEGVLLKSSILGDYNQLSGFDLFITKAMIKNYVHNKNLFGIGYNFFHFPFFNKEKYQELKNEIEKYYRETGEKSILAGFDIGANFVHNFITDFVTENWAKEYVSAVIFYAPYFGGSGSFDKLATEKIESVDLMKSKSKMPGLHIMMPNEAVFDNKTVIRNFPNDGDLSNATLSSDLLVKLGRMDETAKSIFHLTDKHRKEAPKEPPVTSLIFYNNNINTGIGYNYQKSTNSVSKIIGFGDGTVSIDGPEYACKNWAKSVCFNFVDSGVTHDKIPSHLAAIDLSFVFIDQIQRSKTFPPNKTLTITNKRAKYADSNYFVPHRIADRKISYTANGGSQGQYVLSNAFDRKTGTYWVSNLPNNDTFKNCVIVQFDARLPLEAILMDTTYYTVDYDNKKIRDFHGFPTRLNIYSSSYGSEFELNYVFIGSPVNPWDRVQFVFTDPIYCDKLKIEFDEITNQSLAKPLSNKPAVDNFVFIGAYDVEFLEMEYPKLPYTNIEYINGLKINPSNFNYVSNGNHFRRYPIRNAFRGDENAFWIPEQPNTDDFKNNIEVTFNEVTEFDYILFNTFYSEEYKMHLGFPVQINIYTSSDGSAYNHICSFSGNSKNPSKKVKLNLPNKIKCKKIKIEFYDVTMQNLSGSNKSPVIGNIMFMNYAKPESFKQYETFYTSSDYLSVTKIDSNEFEATCNGGSKTDNPFSNVFDGKTDTYWYSEEKNTEDFKNTITISFKETTTLEAFLYDTVFNDNNDNDPITRDYDGFPTIFNIYKAVGDGSFELACVFEGNPTYPMDKIQFVFPKPITCDKLKLEFFEVTPLVKSSDGPLACVAELTFIKYITDCQRLKFAANSGNYVDSNYISLHQVLANEFTYEANGGSKADKPLSNAFDDDAKTYWYSGTANSDSFINTLTLTFKEITELEAFLYDTCYYTTGDQRTYDGFPTILNIYTSIDNGPFKLDCIFTGTPQNPMDRIQFVFEKAISFNKIKFEFLQITPLQADKTLIPVIGNIRLIRRRISFKGVTGNYANSNYISQHQIELSKFTPTTNSGEKSSYPFSNLFDDKSNTYYVSDKENSDTFKNTITIEFKNTHNLDAILFDTAYSISDTTRIFHGYPTILNIYKSLDNDEYELAAEFEGLPFSDLERIQYVFQQPILCKKIKIEMYKLTIQNMFNDIPSGYFFVGGGFIFLQKEEITPLPIQTPNQTPEPTLKATDLPSQTPEQTEMITTQLEESIESSSESSIETESETSNIIDSITSNNIESDSSIDQSFESSNDKESESSIDQSLESSSETQNDDQSSSDFTETPFDSSSSFSSSEPESEPQIDPTSPIIPPTIASTPTESQSPTSSPLPTATNIPTISPIPVEETCSTSHCSIEGNQSHPITLTIISSSFIDSSIKENGGAVNLINAGLKCDGINFINCSSQNGGGGIFINNTVDINSDISLEYIKFTECKAQFGSAVYIFCDSFSTHVSIRFCNFTTNTAYSLNDVNQVRFGGSAIFIAARKGIITNCNFLNNVGDGGSLKIQNHFDNNQNSFILQQQQEEKEADFVVSNCYFQIERNSLCSLYYYRGNKGSFFKLANCMFDGSLPNNARYIDGKAISIDSPKLFVTKCNFSDTYERSINRANNYLSLVHSDQEFLKIENKSDEGKKLSKSTWILIGTVIAVVVVVIALVIALVIFIIISKKKIMEKQYEMNVQNHDIEDSES